MKLLLCRIILFFLYRGMQVLQKRDSNLRQELAQLPVGLTFGIRVSPYPGAPELSIVNAPSGLRRGKSWEIPHILITFKSVPLALRVLTGLEGISEAYARHSFTLKGNINSAMGFVRCVEITEAYLFPSFWARRILKKMPHKQLGSLRVYLLTLLS